MKVNGQNLGDVLRKLPWQYKIVVACSAFFILYAIVYVPYVFVYLRVKPKEIISAPVEITGVIQPMGALDPAVAVDPRTRQVWMAFASQEKNYGINNFNNTMNVRLAAAKANTNCKLWDTRMAGFESKADEIVAPDGQTILRTGEWRVETPALVYDPGDAGKEWKLYAYKYFWDNDPNDAMTVARHYGAIVYKSASDPEGEWSAEQWLFAPGPGYPPSPYQQTVLLQLNQLDASLQNVKAYARPSVISKDGLLVMTLSAFTDGVTPDKVIMIASDNHGNSWHYVGTVLKREDITAIDPTGHLEGATLLEQNGNVYFAAVPGNTEKRSAGTLIMPFEDFSKGLLQRDVHTNVPMIIHQVPLQSSATGTFGGGSAAYADVCKGLLITAQDGANGNFRIYRTPFKPDEQQQ